MYTIIVFSMQHNDWQELMKFAEYADAEQFVESYPRFGARHSRTIRNGNWQIVKSNPSSVTESLAAFGL